MEPVFPAVPPTASPAKILAGLGARAPGSLWITRERPKIDRIACPWLVLRFIDTGARFLYVPADSVSAEAARQGAIPFDVPGVRFSHRGELCSFDTFIEEFSLRDPALADLARIVRGADTDRPELAPQCAGLVAVSLGFSAMHADDQAMLNATLPVYDALLAWLRSARGEVHNARLFDKP